MRCSVRAGGPDNAIRPWAEGPALSTTGPGVTGCRTDFLVSGVPVTHQPLIRVSPRVTQGGCRPSRAGGELVGWPVGWRCHQPLGAGEAARESFEGIYSDVLLREGHPSRGSVYKNFPAC